MGDRANVVFTGPDGIETRLYTHSYGASVPALLQAALKGAMSPVCDASTMSPARSLAGSLLQVTNAVYPNAYNGAIREDRTIGADRRTLYVDVAAGSSVDGRVYLGGYGADTGRTGTYWTFRQYVRFAKHSLPLT